MLKNYLKVALRNLRKHKGYTFINVTGLAVGLACCLIIALFVRDELSYDRFHEKADHIYRVTIDAAIAEQEIRGPLSPAPMAAALVADFPEVVQATRLYKPSFGESGDILVGRGANQFVEARLFYGDSTFFDVFSFPFLRGDPHTALAEPNTIVLTETTARKYFGQEDPLGQTLTLNNNTDYQVTGIIADIPSNSHVHFDFMASLETLGIGRRAQWMGNMFFTYLVLEQGHTAGALEAKFPEVVRRYAGPQFEEILGMTIDQLLASGGRYNYALQPLADIHLHSQLDYEIEPNGDIGYVIAFSVIALLILLIACINFMNLATARSVGRAKEIGVRKVLGSNRRQLILQFLTESILLSAMALLVALVLVQGILPGFNSLSGKSLRLDYLDGFLAPGFLGLVVLVGVLAGSYPAFFLASFQSIDVLKGKLQTGMKSTGLRSGLVVFQFAISIVLMIATAVVFRQVDYMQTKHLGFDKENVVVIERAEALGQQREAFKREALQLPGVLSASASSNLPGETLGDDLFRLEGNPADQVEMVWMMYADHDIVETLDLEMAAGRAFSRDFPTDSSSIILNRTAAELFGGDDLVGKRLVTPFGSTGQAAYTVVGVVEDFHFQSLHQDIRPLGIQIGSNPLYLAVRIRPDDVPGTLRALEAQWQAVVPEEPFTFSFLDANVDALYQADQRTGQLFGTFALLAVLIACLGLFGLAAFTAEQRTKEIGVRKVLGASVGGIVVLLSKDFVKLVGLAFVLAVPLAYLAMNWWLESFAYRADIAWWIFLTAGLAALAIAVLTVSYQAIRAAVADPVKALRYE